MLCLSPSSTRDLIDALGDGFDEKVHVWRESLMPRVEITRSEVCF